MVVSIQNFQKRHDNYALVIQHGFAITGIASAMRNKSFRWKQNTGNGLVFNYCIRQNRNENSERQSLIDLFLPDEIYDVKKNRKPQKKDPYVIQKSITTEKDDVYKIEGISVAMIQIQIGVDDQRQTKNA